MVCACFERGRPLWFEVVAVRTVSFKIAGLDCAEEVAILKREVGRLHGVESLRFDVLSARMTVDFDADQLTEDAIVGAVAAGGMQASPWDSQPGDDVGSFWARHGRFTLMLTSGVLLICGFVVHWVLGGSFLGAFAAGEGTYGVGVPLISRVLYVVSAVSGAWFVVPKAVSAARRLRPDMNLLMVLAVIGALLIGEWLEASAVAFLFALALLLEQWSVGRARRAISALLDLSPARARVLADADDTSTEVPVDAVAVGSRVLVRPGEKIPLDGEVLSGESYVNQAPITGESTPVAKETGDEVYAGTLNGDGVLTFRSTRPASDTTLARIIHMVEEAQSHRSASEQWIERFARVYTPAMLGLATAIALVPPLAFSGSWPVWLYRGLVILVIACPCALVISTPVSVVSGLTAAARHGVLIKGGVYLERAAGLQALALDKTGTLTHGQPTVQRIVPLNGHNERELLERAAALESHSEHPLARAILRRASSEGCSAIPAEGYTSIKGKGGEGTIDGRRFWIGSHRLLQEKGADTAEIRRQVALLVDAGHSVVAVGNDDHVCGLLSVADAPRPGVAETIQRIKGLGVRCVTMLTGDNDGTAHAVAQVAGVDQYRAELLPEDKVAAVRDLVAEWGHAAMVGDGVNDAPAMAASSLGIAMGAVGTDVAIETSDIALMSDDLTRLPWLISHSRRTLRIIKQNIVFSLGLKLLFIILTLCGLASLWMAIAADTGASLLVIFNGLRLLHSGEEAPAASAEGVSEAPTSDSRESARAV